MARDANRNLTVTTKVKDQSSKALKKLGEAGKKASGSIAGGFIKAQISIAGFKAAVKGAARLIKGITVDSAKMADQFAKSSKKLGISVETLSALNLAAELTGMNFASMANGLKILTKNVYDFSLGVGEAKDVFEEMGIVVTRADGNLKDAETLFLEIADAMGKLEDDTKRAAFAQRLFGRSGIEMVPLLKEGRGAIEEMMQEARDFGIVIDANTAKMGEDFVDAQRRFTAAIDGAKLAIAQELLPVLREWLEDGAKWIADHREEIRRWAESAIPKAVAAVKELAGALYEVAGAIKTIWDLSPAKLLAGLYGKGAPDVSQAGRPWPKGTGGPFVGEGAFADFDELRRNRARNIAAMREGVYSTSPPFYDFSNLPRKGGPVDTGRMHGPQQGPGLDFSAFKLGAKEAREEYEDLEKVVKETPQWMDTARSAYNVATDGIMTFVDTVTQGTASLKDAFSSLVRDLLRQLQRLAMNRLFTQLASTIFSNTSQTSGSGTSATAGAGAASDSASVYGMAEGGIVTRPTLAMIGEAGPEAVVPLDKYGSGTGGVTIGNVNVVAPEGSDPSEFGKAVAAAVSKELRYSGRFRSMVRGAARRGLR